MPITRRSDATTWDLPGTRFIALASPTRGDSTDVSVWRLVLEPHTAGTEHHVTRTELFAPIAGTARVTIDGKAETIGVGDALVIPAGSPFSLANPGEETFEAIVALPVGGQAAFSGGEPFTPDWAV